MRSGKDVEVELSDTLLYIEVDGSTVGDSMLQTPIASNTVININHTCDEIVICVIRWLFKRDNDSLASARQQSHVKRNIIVSSFFCS